MWPAKPQPTQRQPHEDPVGWARKETWTFTIWKCKIYGLPLSVNVLLIVLISKGMPGHFLWRWLGIPLALSFAYFFTAFGFYAVSAIGELLDRPQN
jgi:hypothetical protein